MTKNQELFYVNPLAVLYRMCVLPREALAVYAARQDEIALVLSDMVMPDMEGLPLFNTLKAQNPDVRVVLMSGYPLGERGAELLAQGVVDWFQKPITLQNLARIINRALLTRRARWGQIERPEVANGVAPYLPLTGDTKPC